MNESPYQVTSLTDAVTPLHSGMPNCAVAKTFALVHLCVCVATVIALRREVGAIVQFGGLFVALGTLVLISAAISRHWILATLGLASVIVAASIFGIIFAFSIAPGEAGGLIYSACWTMTIITFATCWYALILKP
ncbi:MAG: hypothetical protein U0930_20165 [Pirellulales bacterium]